MRRRLESPGNFNVWPAFTDILAGLAVVLVFLITIFVIGEILISREIMGKDTAIGQLQRIINHLQQLAGEAETESQQLRQQIASLETDTQEQTLLTQDLRQELAFIEAAKLALEQQLSETEQQVTLEATQRERLIAELERLNRALASSQQELAERELVITEQQDRISALDERLKRQLVERVEELERYASDFFGRLREVFANNPDIKVVGDRFVFQSEVLFSSGQAVLSVAGKQDLDKFIEVYRQLETQLPPDLEVIIQILGHTDRVPVRPGAAFASNWELSTQRALDVVNYLIEQGIPPNRLAAVGMGEYHPIDPGNNPKAYRRNRRIELKITSR